jgi:hypothetical protein
MTGSFVIGIEGQRLRKSLASSDIYLELYRHVDPDQVVGADMGLFRDAGRLM